MKSIIRTNNIRIFISSTFKDMQDERNILVKKVFPRLRIEAEKRGVMFSYVDLRWGVVPNACPTEIIEICLSEIENCTPFFLGLIGYNYGTIIPAISNYEIDCIDKKHKGFKELIKKEMSYTELEMRYNHLINRNGVNNYIYIKEQPSIKTFLYFIILFIKRISLKLFFNYPSITDLKNYIKACYISNITPYPANTTFDKSKTFEDIIYKDFIQHIEQNFRIEKYNEKPFIRYNQEIFLRKPKRFIPRKDVQTILNNWENQKCNGTEWLILKGGGGTGKTSILVEYAIQKHPSLNVLYHFVGHSSTIETPEIILKDLIYQICSCLNIDKPTYSNEETRNDLSKSLAQHLQFSHNKTIIIIDGIESISCETDTLMSIISWLPNSVDNLKYILSLNGNKIHTQKYPEWVKMTELELKEFTATECYTITKEYLQQEYSKDVSKIITQEFYEKPEKCFLKNISNLKIFLDEAALLDFGKDKDGKDLKKEIEVISNCKRDTLELVLHRIEKEIFKKEKSKSTRILSFLAISDYGIHENDITAICSDQNIEITQIDWVKLYCQIKRFIISDGYIKLNKDIKEIIIQRYLWNKNTLNEYQCKLALGLQNLSFNKLYTLEIVNNFFKAKDFRALKETLSSPIVITFIYNHNKEMLFDCMKSLKSHNFINELSENLISAIELTEREKQITFYKTLSKIFQNFPAYDIALKSIIRAIELQEESTKKSEKEIVDLANNYLVRIRILTRLYRLEEADKHIELFFKYISNNKQFDADSAIYVRGLIAKAQIYQKMPSVIEQKKAYSLYLEAIEKKDKITDSEYESLLYKCCILCANTQYNTAELSRLLSIWRSYIKKNYIYGTESYFQAIIKQKQLELFELNHSNRDIETYNNLNNKLIEELKKYIELYGKITRTITGFYKVIGDYFYSIANEYWKKNEYADYLKNIDKAVHYYELDYDVIKSIFHNKDTVYANSLFELAKSYQSLIITRPIEKNKYIQYCLSLYSQAISTYRKLFPEGCWEIAKYLHNISDIYKEMKEYELAKNTIDEAIQIKQKFINMNHQSLHTSYTRKLNIYQAEFIDKEIHDNERITEFQEILSQLIEHTRNCTDLSEQEKLIRIKETLEYQTWLNKWKFDTNNCHLKHAKELIENLKRVYTEYKILKDKDINDKVELVATIYTQWIPFNQYIIKHNLKKELETNEDYIFIEETINMIEKLINCIKKQKQGSKTLNYEFKTYC